MPAKLTTTIKKIKTVPNPANAEIIDEFYHYMKGSDVSENHQNNCLKFDEVFAEDIKMVEKDLNHLKTIVEKS